MRNFRRLKHSRMNIFVVCFAALVWMLPVISGSSVLKAGSPQEAATEKEESLKSVSTDSVERQKELLSRMRWLSATTSDESRSTWYRFRFSLAEPSEQTLLTMVSDAATVVTVNGQRLSRSAVPVVATGLPASGWEIGPLLRTGRNVIAVELHAAGSSANLGLSILSQPVSATAAGTEIPGDWKTVSAEPPAGWQQTDFNDRDWAGIEATNVTPGNLNVVLPDEWKSAIRRPAGPRRPFSLQDGDHVVFLGATFLERSQQFGHIESALMAAVGTRRVTWRNLGWDGDTVFSESRGIFDSPEVGYLRMVEHVRAEEPTVIVVCYGQNEALQGDRTPEQFRAQLQKLLDDLSPTGASVVLMSPHELLPSARPIPDPSRFNEKIRAYVEILQEAAETRDAAFVDLFSGFAEDLQRADQILNASSTPSLIDADAHPDLFRSMAGNLSDNGMHFNSRGYRAAALVVRQRLLSVPVSPAEIRINLTDRKLHVSGVEVSQVRWGSSSEPSGKLVQFAFRELIRSPLPVRVALTGSVGGSTDRYLAVVSDQQHGAGTDGAAAGPDKLSIRLRFPEAIDQEGAAVLLADNGFEQLRKTVVRKDELYFHRWRPQNITYLFGFRKHEQGNNAVEIAQFDPFVKKLEDEIHTLQQPRWRNISLVQGD